MSYSLTLRVSGARACFSRAEFKAERASYEVIPPSAARGIFDAVYWRPGLRWVIDCIHVLNPIRFQSLSRSRTAYLAARANGKRVGRSPVLTPEKWKEGGRLLRAGVSVREVAKRLGIAVATTYNHRDAMMSDSVDDLEE